MEDLLNGLNSAQRDAVTHHEGPLLILAGAGTGKTRVLTHRILHLLQKEWAQPEDILALTFTEKAAVEMQERLDVLLPYGYSELWVKTFHGFCEAILREKAHEIGLDPDYRLLSQPDLILFLREHLFTFSLDYYRPLGNPLRFVRMMADHFGRLMDECVSPEVYGAYAKKLLADAKEPAEIEEAEKMVELANAYVRYLALLVEKNVLDFAGLHHFTLRLFTERPSVLRHYQNRFKYLLVDEFQDTNTAQNRLVELLAARHTNLMVVGDDDQSIYKWRGASLANILEFKQHFLQAKQILLTTNYRSTQPILDASHALIQHNNPHRLEAQEGIDKALHTTQEDVVSARPQVRHFAYSRDEAQFVADQIQRQRIENSTLGYRDFAVLVRAGRHAIPFLEALGRQGIPVQFSGGAGLHQQESIKDLVALLRFLANPSDDVALFRLLSHPSVGMEMEYLLHLTHRAKSTSTPLLRTLRQQFEKPDLFFQVGTGTRLTPLLKLFEELRSQSKRAPTSQLLGIFLKTSGYLSALEEKGDVESAHQLEQIAHFSQLIHTFEESHPEGRLLACLEDLEARFDLGERLSPLEVESDADTVKVFTLHAAKGLEFETVFLVDLVQQRFPTIAREEGLEIPEALLPNHTSKEASFHLAEERRLLYVGMTRAKRHLFLTYSDFYEGPKRWKPSIFIEELRQSELVDFGEDGSEKKILTSVVASDAPDEKPIAFTYARDHRSLSLSFSRLQTFQACPLKYKFRYIYHLPEPASHATSFGSSVHNTLNAFYRELKEGQSPSLARLKTLYQQHWIPLGYLNASHQSERKQKGWQILEQFYAGQTEAWTIPDSLEKPFTLKMPSGLVLSGRIDRIDRLPDGTYEVIDYKTGQLKPSLKIDKELQLSIYALACEKVLKLPVSKLSLYYLEDNQKLSTTRSSQQLIETAMELEELASELAQSSFEATPSPMICKMCDYRLLCSKAMA
jgi:DNA helicase-2/ATP-dependent DNA helicase PcrA